MASWLTHAFLAGALGKAQPFHIRTTRFWVLSIFCSIVPDVDILGYAWGIEYSHVLGHRGLMHSLCVAFFAPFDHTRYFFPWTPIVVSPIGADFFGLRGLHVIASEVLFVWVPIMLIAKGVVFLKKNVSGGGNVSRRSDKTLEGTGVLPIPTVQGYSRS